MRTAGMRTAWFIPPIVIPVLIGLALVGFVALRAFP
jgi:hypothetical protein